MAAIKKNISKKFKFFNPHPGFMGATVALPDCLVDLAKHIDDKILKIETVEKRIKCICPDMDIHISFPNTMTSYGTKNKDGSVVLISKIENGVMHSWRFIQFKNIKNNKKVKQ